MEIFFTCDAFEETGISSFILNNLDKVSKAMREKNYGNDVASILFVVCCLKTYPITFPRIKYIKKIKELRFDILLDYNKALHMKNTKNTDLYIIESLESDLGKIVKSLLIKDFNYESFLIDFRELTN